MIKYFLLGSIVFFITSCGKPPVTPVKSNALNAARTLLSKTCAGGSFSIQSSTPVATTGSKNLPEGSAVTVRGTITNSICHGGGRASFTCKGRVAIGTNRAFVCDSGTISGSTLGTTTTTARRPLIVNSLAPTQTSSLPVLSGASNLTEGQILIYDNGTKGSVNLVFPNPKYPVAVCTAGFNC